MTQSCELVVLCTGWLRALSDDRELPDSGQFFFRSCSFNQKTLNRSFFPLVNDYWIADVPHCHLVLIKCCIVAYLSPSGCWKKVEIHQGASKKPSSQRTPLHLKAAGIRHNYKLVKVIVHCKIMFCVSLFTLRCPEVKIFLPLSVFLHS